MAVVKRDTGCGEEDGARQVIVTHGHPLPRAMQEEPQVALEHVEFSLQVTTVTWVSLPVARLEDCVS